MDMSQNEVSVFGSKMAPLRKKNGHLILRQPHMEKLLVGSKLFKTKQLHSHVEITCEVKTKP